MSKIPKILQTSFTMCGPLRQFTEELSNESLKGLKAPTLTKFKLQGGPSGHGKPPVDLVLTVPAAGGPLL